MPNLTQTQFRMLAAAVLIFGAGWMGISTSLPGGTDTPGIPAPKAGFLAPDFTLATLEGESISLSDLRGKAVIVNVWASWCGPCRAEMPALEAVYREYAGEDLVLLAVNAANQDNLNQAAAFVEELRLTFPVLLDEAGQVQRLYQVSALPSTFFIRPDGTIMEVVFGGPMAEALLRTRVEMLLQEAE
ncbi:MAG: TlpA family protein disulfide reductase [Anaerolineales bacterium]|nr:TlpA family protein disulfide reductase [Anaerolineales bacterium]